MSVRASTLRTPLLRRRLSTLQSDLHEEVLHWVPPTEYRFAADFTEVAKQSSVNNVRALFDKTSQEDIDHIFNFTDGKDRMATGTMLHLACMQGYRRIAEALLLEGANPNKVCFYEKGNNIAETATVYAIHFACRSGSAELVETLLKNKADLRMEAYYKKKIVQTPIFDACHAKNIDALRFILSTGLDVNEATDEKGRTPMHVAVLKNNTAAALALLEQKGLDITILSNEHRTALDEAFLSNMEIDKSIVKAILDRLFEVSNGDVDALFDFVECKGRQARGTLLHIACRAADMNMVDRLLAAKADVNKKYNFDCRDFEGTGRALNLAIASDHSGDIVRRLITHGADVKAVSTMNAKGDVEDFASSAVLDAAWFGNVEALRHLQDIRVEDPEFFWRRTPQAFGWKSPLHIAAMRTHVEFVKILCSLKADVTRRDVKGYTPIDEALRYPALAQGPLLDVLFDATLAEVCRIAKVRPRHAKRLVEKLEPNEVRFESRNNANVMVDLIKAAPEVAVEVLEKLTVEPSIRHEDVNISHDLSEDVRDLLVSQPLPSHAVLGDSRMRCQYQPYFSWRVEEDTKSWPAWHQELAPRSYVLEDLGADDDMHVATLVKIKVVQYEELLNAQILKAFADSDYLDAFKSVPVVALVTLSWEFVRCQYWLNVLHDVTLLAVLAMLVAYPQSDLWQCSAPPMLVASALRECSSESLQLKRCGTQSYFRDPWNYLDWIGIAIILCLFTCTILDEPSTLVEDPLAKTCMACILLQRWVKLMWACRVTESLGIGQGVLSVLSTIFPSGGMFIVIICTFLGFLHAFFAIRPLGDDTDLVTSLLRLLWLGDGDGFDGLKDLMGKDVSMTASWWPVIIGVYFFIICILNLLITTLVEAYSEFQEHGRHAFIKERASTASDLMLRNVRLPHCVRDFKPEHRMLFVIGVLFLLVYPAILGVIAAGVKLKVCFGFILLIFQLGATVVVQPSLEHDNCPRFVWVCYDSTLEDNGDAMLNVGCGIVEEPPLDTTVAIDSASFLRPPQVLAHGADTKVMPTRLRSFVPLRFGDELNYEPINFSVDIGWLRSKLTRVIEMNAIHRTRMIYLMNKNEHLQETLKAFTECDEDNNGVLTWNDGEVRHLVNVVFKKFGLARMDDTLLHSIFLRFDVARIAVVSSPQSLCMIDSMLRVVFSYLPERSMVTNNAEATTPDMLDWWWRLQEPHDRHGEPQSDEVTAVSFSDAGSVDALQ